MSLTQDRNTFVSLLEDLAGSAPDFPLYTFLSSAKKQAEVLTGRELLCSAKRIASLLQAHGLSGEPVLVLNPYGPEFIELIFGAMLAGCAPVPVTFHRKLGMADITGLIAATGLRAVLGQQSVLASLKSGRIRSMPAFDAQRHELIYLPIDNVQQVEWQPPQLTDTDVALVYPGLQGSGTDIPSPVSHGELLKSVNDLLEKLATGPGDCLMTSHDLANGFALVLHILLPIRAGCRSIFFPIEFALRDAQPWLSAAFTFKCTMLSAPTALLSKATHISKKSGSPFELSSLRHICVDGDYFAPGLVFQFMERYHNKDFPKKMVFICYGLSESCICVARNDGHGKTGNVHGFSVNDREFIAKDIELLVLQYFGARGLSRCVVLYLDDIRQSVLLAECATRQLAENWQGVVSAIMETVQARTGCRLDRVILLRHDSLPLATSGIVMRQRCVAALTDGSLMLRVLPVRGK